MKSKLCIAASALVMALLGGASANAQYTPSENFYTAGSSAQFNTFGVAAIGTNNNGICGQHHWTGKNAGKAYPSGSSTQNGTYTITLVDPRSGSIVAEPANLWVAWDNNAVNQVAGNGVVCFYASVDSIVGVRAYAARAYLSISSNASGASDASTPAGSTVIDQVPLVGAGEALPAAIYNIINNAVLNAANTDIRPEDAKFATMRALTTLGSQVTGRGVTGWGYGPGPIGTAIQSSQSTTIANPVDFTLDCSDTDPVNVNINQGCGGGADNIREYFEVPIGAAPVMVIANVSNTGTGHLGDGKYTNINKNILHNVLEGTIPYVRDIGYNVTYTAGSPNTWTTTETAVPLNVFLREPLSGTYNTMEWSVPMSLEMDGTQYHPGFVVGMETGVTPSDTTPVCTTKPFTAANCATSSGNPLWQVNSYGGFRGRAIGTGEMVTAVNATTNPDTIGFAFWGFSTYQGKTNIKYLDVDGVDPLYSGPTANSNGVGVFPQCTTNSNGYATSCPNLLFPNIINGSYPIWSKYRLIWDPFTQNTNIAPYVVAAAQTFSDPTVGLVTDFLPAQYMQTFHSHYTQVVSDSGAAYSGNNGFKTAVNGSSQTVNVPETGGDMGGAVLTIQSELDFLTDTGGNQQVGLFE